MAQNAFLLGRADHLIDKFTMQFSAFSMCGQHVYIINVVALIIYLNLESSIILFILTDNMLVGAGSDISTIDRELH